MRYVFDIDGTLTTDSDNRNYAISCPDIIAIAEVNRLYDEGHTIVLFTARGASSGIDWHDITVKQINAWGIKHHQLIDKGKPSWDIFIDDKAINAIDWKKTLKQKKIGFVASAFDLLHAGHCLMLKDAKSKCDYLVAALQDDPSIDRSEKNKPILTLNERYILLDSNKYVDRIVIYNTEEDLERILKLIKPNIRILGSDYKDTPDKIVGKSYCDELYFHNRETHGLSSTIIKNRIKNEDERIYKSKS